METFRISDRFLSTIFSMINEIEGFLRIKILQKMIIIASDSDEAKRILFGYLRYFSLPSILPEGSNGSTIESTIILEKLDEKFNDIDEVKRRLKNMLGANPLDHKNFYVRDTQLSRHYVPGDMWFYV